jgi:hypothetical protein
VRRELADVQQTAAEADQPKYAALMQKINQIVLQLPAMTAADKPALQLQLVELFEAVAAACSTRDNDVFALRILHLCRYQAACLGDLAAAAVHTMSNKWYPYAEAQVYIRAAASSPEMAQLLLGPNPIEPAQLR